MLAGCEAHRVIKARRPLTAHREPLGTQLAEAVEATLSGTTFLVPTSAW